MRTTGRNTPAPTAACGTAWSRISGFPPELEALENSLRPLLTDLQEFTTGRAAAIGCRLAVSPDVIELSTCSLQQAFCLQTLKTLPQFTALLDHYFLQKQSLLTSWPEHRRTALLDLIQQEERCVAAETDLSVKITLLTTYQLTASALSSLLGEPTDPAISEKPLEILELQDLVENWNE